MDKQPVICLIICCLIGTTSAGLPSFSVTPSSARISSGTVVDMGCSGDDTKTCSHSPYICGYYIIKGSSIHPANRVSSQFTADATMTDNYRCCHLMTFASHGRTRHTCSSPHSITVVPKTPVLFINSTRLEFGESVTLICDVDEWSGPPGVKYTFMHNSAELFTGTTRHYTFTANGKSNGHYTCVVLAATHISGTVTSSQSPQVTITVHMSTPPVLETTNSNPEIGESFTLTCKIPMNTYAVQSSLMYRFLTNSSVIHSGSNAAFSFIGNAKSTGDYTCVLFDGTVASQPSLPITIQPQVPTPALQSTHRRPLSGDLITLTCSMQLLVTLPPRSVVYTFMQDSLVIQTVTQNVFSFNATPQSSGDYTCMALVGTVVSNPSTPLTIAVTPTTTPTPTTTRRPIPFACETGPNAVVDYPFIYDPEQYIHCTPNGTAYIETCHQGTQWNQAVRKCAAPIPPIG